MDFKGLSFGYNSFENFKYNYLKSIRNLKFLKNPKKFLEYNTVHQFKDKTKKNESAFLKFKKAAGLNKNLKHFYIKDKYNILKRNLNIYKKKKRKKVYSFKV
jgi:hypothetical protein